MKKPIPYCLPDYLAVPVKAAAAFHPIGDRLSARDVAYLVSALWLAANTDCRQADEPDMFRIPDNGLRHALGLNRREPIDQDDARHKRLRNTVVVTDRGTYDAPFSAWRHNLDDKRSWYIQVVLVDSWRVVPGQPVVYLPLRLLQEAKARQSVEVYLHGMAAAMGVIGDGLSMIRREDDRVVLQATELAYRRFLGSTAKHDLHRIKTEIVAGLDADLGPWAEMAVDTVPRVVSSTRYPQGKFLSARIHVIHPPLAEIEAKAAEMATWMAPVRTHVAGWEGHPPRPRHLRKPARSKPPAPIEHVIALPPAEPVALPPRDSEPATSDGNWSF